MGADSDYKERPRPGEWFQRAACRGMDPDLFFPPKGAGAAAAKKICARCPVKASCLEHALVTQEFEGIYGGLTPFERRPLRRGYAPLEKTVCGTERGFQKHRMRGEEPCVICRCAHAVTIPPYGPFPA